MKIRASIIGVAVPVLVALFLTVDIFILVFDKRFGCLVHQTLIVRSFQSE